MADKKYLDYAGLKRTLAKLLPGARKIWHGNINEWDALPAAEKDKYDQAEITINAVNKIELGNKNLVMNKIINDQHPELIGNIYFSNTITNGGTQWRNTSATIPSLPKGKYLIISQIGMQANPGTQWTMIVSYNGFMNGMGCQTADYFQHTGGHGAITQNADGPFTINCSIYTQRSLTVTCRFAAIKIA